MDQKRFITFLVLSMAIVLAWQQFFMPKPAKKPPAQQAQQAAKDDPANPAGDPAKAADEKVAADDAAQPAADNQPAANEPAAEQPAQLPEHPPAVVVLGSGDPKSGYFLRAELTTKGAAVEKIELNDPRYSEVTDRKIPLKVVGDTETEFETLATSVHQVDGQLAKYNENAKLANVHWEVAAKEPIEGSDNSFSSATFRYRAPDGKLEVRKRFWLEKIDLSKGDAREIRDSTPGGYQLHFELTVENLSEDPASITYDLQGPVGLPLENVEHTRIFRAVKLGFLYPEEAQLPLPERGVEAKPMTAAEIVKETDAQDVQEWKRPLKYIGVDVQYFAALLMPGGDQLQNSYIAVAKPQLVKKDVEPSHSDLSVQLSSAPIPLKGGESVSHEYSLYAGPKRQELLEPIGADKVIEFGWFGVVSKGLLKLLNFFHNSWGVPYGIAIIMLTVIVRGCMFPLSRKQALGAKKMKELQPKIAELRKKYANQKDKMAKAQMELFSKHNYNPFAGCLPIFIQLPIFMGLYQALSNAVDLRMAPFLWFDDLSAPDSLFRLPIALPFLGSVFNLLPIVTVSLFVVQQKMFMPPPTDKEQELQYKMMNFMMVFMGFMFYHVPAGLCVYFIASSGWGIAERKLLDIGAIPVAAGDEPPPGKRDDGGGGGGGGGGERKPDKPGGLWQRLLDAAEQPTSQTASNGKSSKRAGGSKAKK